MEFRDVCRPTRLHIISAQRRPALARSTRAPFPNGQSRVRWNLKNTALEEFRSKLEGLGLRLEDVLVRPRSRPGGRRRRRDTGQTAPIKYRSPQGDSWSGRGRVPQWMQILEAEGHSREEYAVEPEER